MFSNKTTFILGAGASWHYGYPTGEGLVDAVIMMAIRLRDHCRQRLQSNRVVQDVPKFVESYTDKPMGSDRGRAAWKKVEADAQTLIERLTIVKPVLIDYFLGWNESLQPIGKLLIAAVILECEAKFHDARKNLNRDYRSGPAKDDWYRFLIHKLLVGCQNSTALCANRVRFVTFNYDTSLEQLLYEALCSMDMLNEPDVRRFLEEDRVIHIYGSVHPRIVLPDELVNVSVAMGMGQTLTDAADDLAPRKKFLDQCYAASQNLRAIDPHDKTQNRIHIDAAKRWIDESNVIYVLGYGFDEFNSRRLDLAKSLRVKEDVHRSVVFTNFEDLNTVNKRASRLFYGTYDKFLTDFVRGFPGDGNFREKSIRNVYEAMEKDFESLESLLLAGSPA